VRDVGVRPYRRVVDLLDEAHELVHVLQQRLVERLELECDLEALRLGVLTGFLDQVLRQVPDRCAREHLAVPVVLADDEQHVAGTEIRSLVDVRLDPVEREAAYRRVEVDDPEPDAHDGTDPQPDLVARVLDQLPRRVVDVEGVLEDVVRVEADLLRPANALFRSDLRVEPGRANHSELHHRLLGVCGWLSGGDWVMRTVSVPARGARRGVSQPARSPWT
jgi:hypothetical protein